MGSKLAGDTPPKYPVGRPQQGVFRPKPLTAPCCNDVIWSTYRGQYQSCQCGGSAVDQTPYYGRLIGVIAQISIDKTVAKQLVSRKSGEQIDWIEQTHQEGDSHGHK